MSQKFSRNPTSKLRQTVTLYFSHSAEIPENDSCLGDGLCTGLGQVRTVAWVIVVGDGFCNIVDGLTSAAAFSVSISKGISVMIAVYLQELPHRIGDYAVFVNAGMTPFQVTSDFDYPESGLPLFTTFLKATIFNIISTSTAYLGCLMGLLLLDSGAIKEEYIFGIGTF